MFAIGKAAIMISPSTSQRQSNLCHSFISVRSDPIEPKPKET